MNQPLNFQGTPKENIRTIRILCLGLITGPCIFSALSILVNRFDGAFIDKPGQYRDIFLGILAGMSVICIIIAQQQYKKGVTIIRESSLSLNEKLDQYRGTMIKYMALHEMPTLFSVIVFMLIGKFYIFGVTALMLALMLMKFPTIKKVSGELQLGWQQQNELE